MQAVRHGPESAGARYKNSIQIYNSITEHKFLFLALWFNTNFIASLHATRLPMYKIYSITHFISHCRILFCRIIVMVASLCIDYCRVSSNFLIRSFYSDFLFWCIKKWILCGIGCLVTNLLTYLYYINLWHRSIL